MYECVCVCVLVSKSECVLVVCRRAAEALCELYPTIFGIVEKRGDLVKHRLLEIIMLIQKKPLIVSLL